MLPHRKPCHNQPARPPAAPTRQVVRRPAHEVVRGHQVADGGHARGELVAQRPGDDLLVGRLIAEQGYRVELLAYSVQAVADYRSVADLVHKRMRWMVVMRHIRTWGHLGLVFTQGLFWSLMAVAVRPTLAVACTYLGAYATLRVAITWAIGSWGLQQKGIWKHFALVPVWDALAFCIWVASFTRSTIRWRGADYYIRDGILVPADSYAAKPQPAQDAFEPENSEVYPEV